MSRTVGLFDRPFIRLPEPHANLVIATPSLDDVDSSVRIVNNPRVLKWVLGSTSPYTTKRAEDWINGVKKISEELLQAPLNAHVDGCPFRHIMDLEADGTCEFIGDIGISRSNWTDITDQEERRRLLEENSLRPVGEQAILFQVGYYLSPAYQGRGIMTSALSTLLTQWAIPRMNAHKIKATLFQGNLGSRAVLTRNGFTQIRKVEKYKELDGDITDLFVFEWTRDQVAPCPPSATGEDLASHLAYQCPHGDEAVPLQSTSSGLKTSV
ncbi:hypothetical protein AAF712_006919 [Marasmius tenuissimus]|uniref:N-acetyltransferase domain-containing protein n=1 Tax=Marasmius tenuissimus TaxID=585030 RepID=A0ABR2ZXJ9_9AGAR|nr:hypothetical protein PM082_010297 [Marasmius tenuissimus]